MGQGKPLSVGSGVQDTPSLEATQTPSPQEPKRAPRHCSSHSEPGVRVSGGLSSRGGCRGSLCSSGPQLLFFSLSNLGGPEFWKPLPEEVIQGFFAPQEPRRGSRHCSPPSNLGFWMEEVIQELIAQLSFTQSQLWGLWPRMSPFTEERSPCLRETDLSCFPPTPSAQPWGG